MLKKIIRSKPKALYVLAYQCNAEVFSLKTGLCVWLEFAFILLSSSSLEKPLHIVTKLPRKVCPEHCRRNLFLWKNVDSNLCQFINVFLTVIYHKIFDQSLEYSSSVGLRFSFFISFRFSSKHKLKFGRTKTISTSTWSGLTLRHMITLNFL